SDRMPGDTDEGRVLNGVPSLKDARSTRSRTEPAQRTGKWPPAMQACHAGRRLVPVPVWPLARLASSATSARPSRVLATVRGKPLLPAPRLTDAAHFAWPHERQ